MFKNIFMNEACSFGSFFIWLFIFLIALWGKRQL
jgi:hypothetical protein